MMLVMHKRRNRALIHMAIAVAAITLGWLAAGLSLGQQLELRTYDYRFKLKDAFRAPADSPTAAPVTVLAIDDASIARIPDPLMLWHKHFAEVLNGLAAGGAAAVGVDVVFASIDQFDPEGQRSLAQALLRSVITELPIVLAYRVRAEGVEQPPPALSLALAPENFAYANLTVDPDDFVRRQSLQQPGDDNSLRPGLALAVASAFAKRTGRNLNVPAGPEPMLINFKPAGSFPRVPFYDVLDAARKNDSAFLRDKFSGRVVLIGRISARGGDDLHSTPLYYSARDDAYEGLRTPGVDIHAHAIATLLEERPIRPLAEPYQTLLTILIALATTFAWGYLAVRWAAPATLFVLASFTAFVLAAFLRDTWVTTVAPITAGGAALMLTLGINYFMEGKEKRKVRNLFGRYVSDSVIGQLMDRPEGIVLDGESKRIAVLFADIKGFTTLSEKTAEPERIVQMLNEYFGAIVDVIQSHRGTVSLLIGDGIMAIFGAPVKDDDAALHAVQAAQEMMRALGGVNERLIAKGFDPIGIGIGINSGSAVVGNIGSPRKMEYTAIGDVVNTAARIEGHTRKVPDADILISHDTYAWLADRIPAEYVGEADLKGKESRVGVYRVRW